MNPAPTRDIQHEATQSFLAEFTPQTKNEPTAPDKRRLEMTEIFQRSTLSALAFSKMEIPERKTYLAPFFRAGDYGLLFAPRGVGKSWLSLLIGKALSEAGTMGSHWKCETPHRVLYLDSEMNIADLQKRCQTLDIAAPLFHILSHETIFTESADKLSLNLADPAQQLAILEHCEREEIQVLILDNLSTAFEGLNENESDSWEKVGSWLLDLRRRGIAVVLVCHAGRNGNIRGTSRREDSAHWILSLEEGESREAETHVFQSRFTKCRNCAASQVPPLKWTIQHTAEGCTVKTETIEPRTQMIDLITNGMASNADLAKALSVSPSAISKWAKRAAEDGLIKKTNGLYLPL